MSSRMKLCMDMKQALLTMVRSVNELHIEGGLDATVQVCVVTARLGLAWLFWFVLSSIGKCSNIAFYLCEELRVMGELNVNDQVLSSLSVLFCAR